MLYSFRGIPDGANPSASVIDVHGVLYGTTEYGGLSQNPTDGTVFRISLKGAEKVLHRFYGYAYQQRVYNDGANPAANLIDVKGELYGTTAGGGSSEFYENGFQSQYEEQREGALQLRRLLLDGANPIGGLLDIDDTLYGTTAEGGQVQRVSVTEPYSASARPGMRL